MSFHRIVVHWRRTAGARGGGAEGGFGVTQLPTVLHREDIRINRKRRAEKNAGNVAAPRQPHLRALGLFATMGAD